MSKYTDYLNNLDEQRKKLKRFESVLNVLNKKLKTKKLDEDKKELKKNILNYENEILELKKELDTLETSFFNYIEFEYDNDLKIGYLKEKSLDTAKSDYLTMVAVDEFEVELGKPVYNFSILDRDDLMYSKFNNTTINSAISVISRIKLYIDYCIKNGKVAHMQNVFTTLTKEQAKKFVSKQSTDFKYISLEQLRGFQQKLDNEHDKLLIELPYFGIRGRTLKGATLEEIINLQIDPKSEDTQNCLLTLERNDGSVRLHEVPKETMDLILRAYNTEEYQADSKKCVLNRCGHYVFRTSGINKFSKITLSVLSQRFKSIQYLCNNSYITVGNLYTSGMVHMAKEILKKNGELTQEDYIDICDYFRFGGGKNNINYTSKLKDILELYLKGSD